MMVKDFGKYGRVIQDILSIDAKRLRLGWYVDIEQ
jgi:hypothetical protein